MAAASPSPVFRTSADSVNAVPVVGLLSLTDGESTTRSGLVCTGGSDTSSCTDVEQLFAVSDSPATASTHAP